MVFRQAYALRPYGTLNPILFDACADASLSL